MREILFRGQTRRYGEKVNMAGEKQASKWVYGGIFLGTGTYSIIYGNNFDKHTVYSDTIGQYTGLTDKTGKKIFEGDLVIPTNRRRLTNKPCVVEFNPMSGYWMCSPAREPLVIGNIHDNPELLGGADNGE